MPCSDDTNINPGPTTVNDDKIPLNTLPFYNYDKPSMLPKCNSSDYTLKNKRACNINNLLNETDEISVTAKQPNASITGINDAKLDSSFLSNELNIEDPDIVRLYFSGKGGRVLYVRKSLS